jgi:hypothetical protein
LYVTATLSSVYLSLTVWLISQAVGCLIANQPVPRYVTRLVKSFRKEECEDIAPIIELFIILSSLVNLYIEAERVDISDDDGDHLCSALSDIDADLISWKKRLPPIWTGDPNTGSAIHSGNPLWIPKLWGYYQLCRILTQRVILDHTVQSAQRREKSLATLSEMSGHVYQLVPMMLRRSFCPNSAYPEQCLGLTSDVFFLVTILQALIKLTDRRTVVDEWAGPAQKQLGERFTLLRAFVARFLH